MNSLYDEFRVALHSVWTRRWLVLAVAWGICILGWLAIASIPNRYDSRARLLVDINEIIPADAQSGPYADRARIDIGPPDGNIGVVAADKAHLPPCPGTSERPAKDKRVGLIVEPHRRAYQDLFECHATRPRTGRIARQIVAKQRLALAGLCNDLVDRMNHQRRRPVVSRHGVPPPG